MRAFNKLPLGIVLLCVLCSVGIVWADPAKTSSIEGRVLDGKGNPVEGVSISAVQVNAIKGYEKAEATTDAKGVYTLNGLYPESEYDVSPKKSGWGYGGQKVSNKSAPAGETAITKGVFIFRFKFQEPGFTVDTKTGLQWLPDSAHLPTTWEDAKAIAKNTTVDGGGWRLPTKAELLNLVDTYYVGTNIDPIFDVKLRFVWTAEPRDNRTGICVDFKHNEFKLTGDPISFISLNSDGTECTAFLVREPKK